MCVYIYINIYVCVCVCVCVCVILASHHATEFMVSFLTDIAELFRHLLVTSHMLKMHFTQHSIRVLLDLIKKLKYQLQINDYTPSTLPVADAILNVTMVSSFICNKQIHSVFPQRKFVMLILVIDTETILVVNMMQITIFAVNTVLISKQCLCTLFWGYFLVLWTVSSGQSVVVSYQ